MVGATSSVKGFLVGFLTHILPKIDREPTREVLIDLHQLSSGDAASVESNLGGGQHGHLVLMMTAEEYRAQAEFSFLPPHNPGNYLQSMGRVQEQAIVTEKLGQNQELFCKYTAVDRALKNKIVTVVEPVFLSPLVDHITGF